MIKKLTDTELKEMTRQQLCDYCRANKIKGYSGKNKAQRVDLILKHYGSVSTKQQFTKGLEEILELIAPIVASQYWKGLSREERMIVLKTINYTGKATILNKEYPQMGDDTKHKIRIDSNFKKYTKAIDKHRLIQQSTKDAPQDKRKCSVCSGTLLPLFEIKSKLICKDCYEKPTILIVRRKSIPSESKTSKDWKFYVKIGKEKVYIGSQEGRKKLVRLDRSKSMLRDTLRWRYSISYNYDGIVKVLSKNIEHADIKYESGYYVSGITDIVVDKMNMLAKKVDSEFVFKLAERKKKIG